MADFYADFPFPEVVLKVSAPEKFCSVGDVVAGMVSGEGRVERFVEGGIVVHSMRAEDFRQGDVLVSPTASATVLDVARW